jgi:hypothetical protein
MLATFGIRTDLAAGNHSDALALKDRFRSESRRYRRSLPDQIYGPGPTGGAPFRPDLPSVLRGKRCRSRNGFRQPALASGGMIEGAAAALCLFCIPLLAIIPFCSPDLGAPQGGANRSETQRRSSGSGCRSAAAVARSPMVRQK